MKKSVISLTLAILFSLPFVGLAEVTVATKIVGKTITLTFLVNSSQLDKGELLTLETQKIILKDKYGYTLYQESINAQQTPEKNYNLKEIPNGEYVFAIYDRAKVTMKPFTIEGETIKLKDEYLVFKPMIVTKDKNAAFNLLAFKKRVNLKIMDNYGKEVFSQSFENKATIGKRFDFSVAPEGTYKIQTIIDNHVFTKTIII